MKQERTQRLGHYGIHFDVTTLTILPADRPRLRELYLCEAGVHCWEIVNLIVATYDRMLAQQLPCEMTVAISRPLTRDHGDRLNAQRGHIATAIGAIVGAPFKPLGTVVAFLAGGTGKAVAHYKLGTHHAGDVIVAVYARVNGGIGPQSTSSAFLIKAMGGIQ